MNAEAPILLIMFALVFAVIALINGCAAPISFAAPNHQADPMMDAASGEYLSRVVKEGMK